MLHRPTWGAAYPHLGPGMGYSCSISWPSPLVAKTMPNKVKEHSDNVLLVCGVCLLKPKSGIRNISAEALRRIRKHIFKPYLEPEWEWLPSVICGTCYRALSEAENKVGTTVNHIDYSDLRSPTFLINFCRECQFYWQPCRRTAEEDRDP